MCVCCPRVNFDYTLLHNSRFTVFLSPLLARREKERHTCILSHKLLLFKQSWVEVGVRKPEMRRGGTACFEGSTGVDSKQSGGILRWE